MPECVSVDACDNLLTAAGVRQRCNTITQAVREGRGLYFEINEKAIETCSRFVAEVCEENYPDLNIPLHARWRHFQIGKFNLWQHYIQKHRINALNADQRMRCAIDLTFISVLLDAGAGNEWSYLEPVSGTRLSRSEGLAAASVHYFFNGLAARKNDGSISATANDLIRANAKDLCTVFQVTANNRLAGVEGRVKLLNQLGQVLQDSTDMNCPSDIVNSFALDRKLGSLDLARVLQTILCKFNSVWPNGIWVGQKCYGDAGYHSLAPKIGSAGRLIPFHKLSQWLSYSLVEPLRWGGWTVTNIDGLTGLPEYRNGGLLIDSGVLQAKNPAILKHELSISSEAVVEWRALTVSLLDEIAVRVRKILNQDSVGLPLSSVLEGGTWAAGRKIAYQKRGKSIPPIKLTTDGTVF